jgi:hypothetical protein
MLALLDEISKKKLGSQTFGGFDTTFFDPVIDVIDKIDKDTDKVFERLGEKNVGGYSGIPPLRVPQRNVGGYSGIPPLRVPQQNVGGYSGIPRLAAGGVVTQPTLAMIGEAGAEAVIPLDRMGSMGTKVVVNVQGSVISEGQLQSVIQDVLYNLNRTGAVTQLTNLGR